MVPRRIAALLSPDAPERVYGPDESPRPVRGGDVAVLFRKFTNLESFRRALLRRRIPHLVYKGRGFHGARGAVELVALLAAAAGPADHLALSSVLPTPFGPVPGGPLARPGRRRRTWWRSGIRTRCACSPSTPQRGWSSRWCSFPSVPRRRSTLARSDSRSTPTWGWR